MSAMDFICGSQKSNLSRCSCSVKGSKAVCIQKTFKRASTPASNKPMKLKHIYLHKELETITLVTTAEATNDKRNKQC